MPVPTVERSSSTSKAALVTIEDVSKVFGKGERSVHALEDINLDIAAGEFIALVGSSGCGKSTLLRMLDGLSLPTSGVVRVGGDVLDGPRLDIGMMLQQPTLLAWRTVLDNVLLPVDVHRRPSRDDRARTAELIEMVGLSAFSTHYPRELSGGMQQRVALARVLQRNPALMLLDEPFGALDDFTREKLNLQLAELVAQQGASVVLVTHNISEAVFLADRVVALGGRPGRVRGVVENPIPRPRALSVMRSPEFHDHVDRVRDLLGLE